jgi:serine/threonine protein kinase
MHPKKPDNPAKELFESLLECSEEERRLVLSAADDEVRREVEELLVYHGQPDGFLMKPLIPSEPSLPNSIGPYALVEEIGSGGTSRVFLARRSDDLHKKLVALKVIRRIVADRESERAFRREVEALSRVEHPFIVRFLDGGVTEDGYLYFAMEYIRGEKITVFASSTPLRERLILFQKVCEAVSFAHRHLIVHRDLKPSNILVQEDGTPKLLDFGIALLLDQETRETLTGFDRMTLAYASPEQVRGEKKLTTASDVYSLGVVLYELLSESMPFSADLAHETMRAIVEDDPKSMRPSGIPEDLEAVVLTALSKEPERRYRTVDDLRRDVGRFLDGFPVQAHRDSFVYRARKFTRRHRKALALGTILVILAVGAGLSLLHQYRLANRRLEDALELLGAQFMYLSYEQRTPQDMLETAEYNRKTLIRLVRETGNETATLRLVHLLHYIGTRQGHASFAIKSNVTKAKEVLTEAANLAQRLYDRSPETYTILLSMTRTSLGAVLFDLGERENAMQQFEMARAIDLIPARSADDEVRRGVALSHVLIQISRVMLADGQTAEAIRIRKEVQEICREVVQALPSEAGRKVDLANAHGLYAAAMRKEGQMGEAVRAYNEAVNFLDGILKTEDRMDWRTLRARLFIDRGSAYIESGRIALGLSDVKDAVAAFREFEKVNQTSANRRSLAAALSWLAVAVNKDGRGGGGFAKEALSIIRKEAAGDVANLSLAREATEISERLQAIR